MVREHSLSPRHRRRLEPLTAPEHVLLSDHATPRPDLSNDPIAMFQGVFDAVDAAARDAGLSDRGVGVTGRERGVIWGADAESELATRGSQLTHPGAEPAEFRDTWPWETVVWADPSRSTVFMFCPSYPNSDFDIMAWGPDAQRCLTMVEQALDRDDLWD